MSYVSSLTAQQKNNLVYLVDEAVDSGIVNPYSIAAFIAIISKESNLIPVEENGNYSAERICQIWSRLCQQRFQLAHNPQKLFDAAYGGRYGNSYKEGYKYRGRGYNQLTFKDNYKFYGNKIGLDLVADPNLVLNPAVASQVAAEFAKQGFKQLKSNGKLSSYGNAKDINDFNNLNDAVEAFYHANAGTGKSVAYIKGRKDNTGGMTKALSRVESIYEFTEDWLKKNPVKRSNGKLLPLAAVGGLAFFLYKLTKK
jgi:putative chitinase